MFIISGKSKVQLKVKFKPETIKNHNFVVDTLLLALKNKVVGSANPRIYLCKSEKIVDMKEFTYHNSDSVFKYVDLFLKK